MNIDLDYLLRYTTKSREEEEKFLKQILGDAAFLHALGLRDLQVTPKPERYRFSGSRDWQDTIQRMPGSEETTVSPYTCVASGSLGYIGERVKEVVLPDEPVHFSGEDLAKASGKIEIQKGLDKPLTIAAEFELGNGRVILVSDPCLFVNQRLGHADNPVLAYHLAVGRDAREIVVDEYYHDGAIAQGNPFVLLGVYPYGIIAGAILLASLLWAWCYGIRFGPPTATPEPSRRNILEYVGAMAGLFRRGQKTAFVLRTCRDGFLDKMRNELRLPAGCDEPAILQALARVDAARAMVLEQTLRDIEAGLANESQLRPADLLQLQERLDSCRVPMHPQRWTGPRWMSPRFTAAR
ncbi:MAG: hypothetical protein HY706_01845 [Candidatus Hydrogenedentes bacterium]|nr:hypothetical protein [Candidatus Hydrogenedentota bacterium]